MAQDIEWDSDAPIPLTGIRVGNGYNANTGSLGIMRILADIAVLKSDDVDDDPDWNGFGADAARWPEPFQYADLNKNGPQWLRSIT